MPRYTPLPLVQIDPRDEESLLQSASQRVYEASGGTINDFSSGSPLRALLEGQVFAQSEFLHWLNRLPDAILTEWIGPYLGAMRSLGSPSEAQVTFQITPRSTNFVVPAGFVIYHSGTDEVEFILTENLVIPPNTYYGVGKVECTTLGTQGNVGVGVISRPKDQLTGLVSVFNSEPATGGEDVEDLSQVKERFFRQIRRRIPVSSDDWKDLVEDVLGTEVVSNVIFSRSSRFNHLPTLEDNHHFSIFAINSDGNRLTATQIEKLRSAVANSSPVGISGNIHPMEVKSVDVDVVIRVDSTPSNPRDLSLSVKEALSSSLKPDGEFPPDYIPKVNDLESAVRQAMYGFTDTLKYRQPDVESMVCYVLPESIPSEGTYRKYESSFLVNRGDLVIKSVLGDTEYYKSLSGFNPVTSGKKYHVDAGDLVVRPVLSLETKVYQSGDVIGSGSDLFFVMSGFSYSSGSLVGNANVYGPLTPETWTEGFTYNPFQDGTFVPKIFTMVLGDLGGSIQDPSSFVFLISRPFTSARTTSSLATAQSLSLISGAKEFISTVEPGVTYSPGSYVRPIPGKFGTDEEGYISPAYKVVSGFSLDPSMFPDYRTVFRSLIDTGSLLRVKEIVFEDETGNIYEGSNFQYRPRFSAGEYLRYRPNGGVLYDREDCLDSLDSECAEIVSSGGYEPPKYFLALRSFTPTTNEIQKMVESGLILEVDSELVTSFRDIFHLSPGDTVGILEDLDMVPYLVNSFVTPVFPPEVYISNGVFTRGNFQPNREFTQSGSKEDIIESGEGVYRVVYPFTPQALSNPRIQEIAGNLQKVVVRKEGIGKMMSPFEKLTSVTYPGILKVTIDSGVKLIYQWEGDTLTHETSINDSITPMDYGQGSIAL